MTREEIARWVVLALLGLGVTFNNYLLPHVEDQLDEVVKPSWNDAELSRSDGLSEPEADSDPDLGRFR